jgi:lysophospholipase L1-like esterase
MSRYTLFFIVIFVMAGAFLSWVSPLLHAASATGKPVLYIVGDSTVHNPQKKLNQCGWGDVIDAGFDLSKIEVKNVARGGRSSRSFIEEGLWEKEVLNHLKPGDFVFVQFGHNDGGGFKDPKSATRASLRGVGEETQLWVDPQTSKTITVHTFGYYMRQYVREAKAKGANVVVLSLVPRDDWNKEGTAILRARPNGYAEWAEQAAKAEGALFVDLNEISAKKLEAIGKANTRPKYFPSEHTHTSPLGALLNAQSVLDGIKALPNNPSIARYILPGPLPASAANKNVTDAPDAPKDQPEAVPAVQ